MVRSAVNRGYGAVEHAFSPVACVAPFEDPNEGLTFDPPLTLSDCLYDGGQEAEERDFHVATDSELDNAGARELGAGDPEREWVLTDRDVWHKNPFYKGKPTPHPEDDHAWDELEANEALMLSGSHVESREDCETCQRHGACTCLEYEHTQPHDWPHGNLDDMPF